MNSWQFFAAIFQSFDANFLISVQGMIGAMVTAVRVPLLVGVTLYIAGMAAMELYEPASDPLFMLFRKVIRAAIVLAVVNAANYTNGIATLLLTTLPNELTAAVTGTTGNGPLAPAAFDTLLNSAWAAGQEIYRNIPAWSFKGLGLMMFVVLFWVLSATAITGAFLIFILSHILLGLLIATGPLFIGFLLWERTYQWFSGWLSGVLTLIVAQVFTVALCGLLLPQIAQLIRQVAALNGNLGINANDEMAQLHYLMEAGLLFAALAFLTMRMPGLAQGVMGGVAGEIGRAGQMAHTALAGHGRAAAGIVRAASQGHQASQSAGLRSITPVGRSVG